MSNQVDARDEYVATIGIECHVQLATKTKLFSGAANDARGAAPNSVVSPICFGMPGVLPMLNKQAVELAIRAGVALGASVNEHCTFDRKHYFYPDLPKGYQITQLEKPIITDGEVNVPLGEGDFTVSITQAHLEEDAGKLTHPKGADYSLVDLNRAGTPLIEIVSGPDMHTPAEAKRYAQELYLLMTYAGVTNGDLYHGNMRFDVNVSVAKKGATALGTRTETKNLNSFRSVEKAAAYEIKRHIELLKKGETPRLETRGWNEAKQKTTLQRSKENVDDYRYFPDADIPPVAIQRQHIEGVRRELEPQLPTALRKKLTSRGVSVEATATLFMYPLLLDRAMKTMDAASDDELRQIVALLVNVLPANFDELQPEDYGKDSPALPHPEALVGLIRLVNEAKISSTSAKDILRTTWQTLQDPEKEADKRGLLQVSDEAQIIAVIDDVLADPASQKSIQDIQAGNEKAIGFLIGQVMQRSQGKANPQMAGKLLRDRLGI